MSATTAGPGLPDPQASASPAPVEKMTMHDWGALPPCPSEGNSWVMECEKGYHKEIKYAGQDYEDPNMDFTADGKAIPSSWVPEYPLPPDFNEYSEDAQRWVKNLWCAAVMSAIILGREDLTEAAAPLGVLDMAKQYERPYIKLQCPSFMIKPALYVMAI